MTDKLQVVLHTLSPDSYNAVGAGRFVEEYPDTVEYIRHNGVDEALHSFVCGVGDLAVLALKNTITGRVENHLKRVVRAIKRNGLYLVGYQEVEVDHVLAVLDKDVSVADLTEIVSHPAANEQTIDSREELEMELKRKLNSQEAPDTGTAAELVRSRNSRKVAAVTSRQAAVANGLHILKEKFYDGDTNHTTFWVLGRDTQDDPRANRTLIELQTKDHNGALRDALHALAVSDIGLHDIDHTQTNGNKHFILELNGGAHEERIQVGIEETRKVSKGVDLLGSMRTKY